MARVAVARSLGGPPAHYTDIAQTFGVVYTVRPEASLTVDITHPDNIRELALALPCVVVIHGGGWVSDSSATANVAQTAADLASLGYVVFNINYRLAPPGGTNHGWEIVDDVYTFMDWLRQNAGAYYADPQNVAILGGSAGGHLALMCALTGGHGGTAAPLVAVSWAGACRFYGDPMAPSDPDPRIENFTNCSTKVSCDGTPNDWDLLSPYHLVQNGTVPLCPIFLGHETDDATVDVGQSRDMDTILTTMGWTHVYHEYAGVDHAFAGEDKMLLDSVGYMSRFLRLARTPVSGRTAVGSRTAV